MRKNPFKSQEQWKSCFARRDPNWDCEEYAQESPPYSSLPKRLAKNSKHAGQLKEIFDLERQGSSRLDSYLNPEMYDGPFFSAVLRDQLNAIIFRLRHFSLAGPVSEEAERAASALSMMLISYIDRRDAEVIEQAEDDYEEAFNALAESEGVSDVEGWLSQERKTAPAKNPKIFWNVPYLQGRRELREVFVASAGVEAIKQAKAQGLIVSGEPDYDSRRTF